jgi:hypothetical protein
MGIHDRILRAFNQHKAVVIRTRAAISHLISAVFEITSKYDRDMCTIYVL